MGDMYSMRNLLTIDGTGKEGTPAQYTPIHDVETGQPWGQYWDGLVDGQGPRFLFFGHDAPRGLQQWTHAWGLDTNCCNGGKLTACILPTREIISISALGNLHKIGDGSTREWRP